MTAFLVSFCVFVVVISVSKWLISDGEMKSITNFFCALVFIITVISRFPKAELSFPAVNTDTNDYSAKLCESAALPVIAAVLSEEDIAYEKIEVKADKTEDGSIIISKVTVFSKESDIKKTEELLCSKLNTQDVEVISD